MPESVLNGEVLTLKEVAAYLKVDDRTIYRLAASKKIPAFKVGGTWRFRKADIDEWIEAQVQGSVGGKP
ncbi:MAG TPA: helix-turn-helix domain-containing protein [Bellilinea sp.]|nr:helix-turn-helix domain-containing protein [Bellilinea sp.]